ncbi:unnamed protein product, partial [Rotaria sp. Silwood2]
HADKCFPILNITTTISPSPTTPSTSTTTSSPSSTTSSSSISFTSSSSTSAQVTLNQMGFTKSIKFNEKDIRRMKDLSVEWVCGDIRPFSIFDDVGFRRLAPECVRLGSIYGAFDLMKFYMVKKTISRHIISFADNSREQIKELLSIPLQEHSLTICPDYWTDLHKKMSYLGVNALHKYLSFFGINSLADINIVCDRGSNFVCAFKDFEPVFCYGHRLNNIAKLNFFQNKRKKEKVGAVVIDATNILDTNPPSTIKAEDNDNEIHESSSDDSELSTDDDFANDTALPVIRKKKKFVKVTVSSKNDLLFSQKKITVKQIPISAKHVLQVLNKCKKIVKYVKKTGINNDIKQECGATLDQSCIVRWLSMLNLLESMLKSFKATKRLLLARNKHSLINDLDLATLKQLV